MRNRADNQIYRKYIAQLATAYRNQSDLRVFIELLLTILAIFVFSVFAIRPTLVTIGGLTTEIQEKQQTIATMDAKIENIIAAQELFTREQETLRLLDTAVPAESAVVEYIQQLEKIGSAHNVQTVSMTMDDIPLTVTDLTKDTQEKSLLVNTILTGSATDLQATLKDIENLRRPMRVSHGEIYSDISSTDDRVYVSLVGEIPFVIPPTL